MIKSGTFNIQKNENRFWIESTEFYIGKRKSPAPHQTLHYLMQLKPQRQYVSNLYPKGNFGLSEVFKIDHKGIVYRVMLNDSLVSIEELGSRWISS